MKTKTIGTILALAFLLVITCSFQLDARHHCRRASFGFGFGVAPAAPTYVVPVAPAPAYVDPYGNVIYPAPAPCYVYPAAPRSFFNWGISFWR